jgi:hypothetical protein
MVVERFERLVVIEVPLRFETAVPYDDSKLADRLITVNDPERHHFKRRWGLNWCDMRGVSVGWIKRLTHKGRHAIGRHRKSWWTQAIEGYAAIGVLGL